MLSFIYLVKGLTNATSQDVAWCPKHQKAKWCCWFDGHCLKKKEYFAPFIKRKSFFLFTLASSPFPLETSGSFFKFNSFLFIYLINYFKFNLFIYLFVPYIYKEGFGNKYLRKVVMSLKQRNQTQQNQAINEVITNQARLGAKKLHRKSIIELERA